MSALHRRTLSFWGFSRSDDEFSESNREKLTGEVSEPPLKESKSSKSPLVSATGDNSPLLNPLLILPTNRKPVFPGYLSAITVKDEATIDQLRVIREKEVNSYVGVFLQKDTNNFSSTDVITDFNDIHSVGTFAQVQNIVKTDVGAQLILLGHRRVSLLGIDSFGPPAMGRVKHWRKPLQIPSTDRIKAYMNEIISAIRELVKINPLLQEQMHMSAWMGRIDLNDPYQLADFATAISGADGVDLQQVLELENIEERLAMVLRILVKDKEVAKLQKEINKQVEEKMSKQQREYWLREQLKSIKKELGMEKDGKEDLVEKFRTQLDAAKERKVTASAISVLEEELKKLEALEKSSPEFNVTRSYLEWLFSIPWGVTSQDTLQLQQARQILDEDHYGLQEIKTRILEFIAVGKLKGSVSGKIICFIGPPGVGKTSIAKSIARALDRKFYRFSVGGLTDTAEIKGHRRTYIGAMPGKPIQCLKTTGVMNPLILIDEIDKLGRSHNGDPASALLELLDPNQNSSFIDHYLDTPVDFSNVLFVCTANDESTIPGPLKDRMEVIRLSGYDVPEKIAIASQYLVPKAARESGLVPNESTKEDSEKRFHITDNALEQLIRNYCRESGVRSLEKSIDKISRKIAFELVGKSEQKEGEHQEAGIVSTLEIDVKDIEKYAGKPIFAEETMYESKDDAHYPPGIVMGLAWNPLGGSPIFIETAATSCAHSERDTGVHMVTGQLGSVMRESVNIAYTYARKFVRQLDNENNFFNNHQVHLHVPEGAISKDGPSAGVAMTTSFLSIALNQPVRPRVAMTGEISLTGKVLPVGGIKEKTLAAKRSGAKTILLPYANKRDFDELPDYVKADVEVHFIKEYEEAFKILFPRSTHI
jgi:Lon-like ATP-dependent protease